MPMDDRMIIFQVYRLHWCISFLVSQQQKGGKIGILVLWRVREKLYCSV